MYCKNCGKENADNARFCQQCGSNLSVVNVYEQPTQPEPRPVQPETQAPIQPEPQPTQPEPVRPQSQEYSYNEYSYQDNIYGQAPAQSQPNQYFGYEDRQAFAPHPVIDVTRKALSSPLMLIATILATIQVLFSIFFTLIDSSSMYLYQLFGNISYSLPGDMDDVFTLGTGWGSLMGILAVIGLWITFASANGKGRLKTGGLTLIKAVSIVWIVLCSICEAALIFVGVLLAVGADYIQDYYYGYYYVSGMSIVILLLVYIGALLIYVALMIIFYAKISGMMSRVKKAASYGTLEKNVSVYVIVMLFIMGIATVVTAFTFTYFPLYMVYTFISAAVCILFAVALIKYRVNVKAVK